MYADTRIEGDKKQIETLAMDWAEEQLELKNLKKRIKLEWSED